MTTADFETVEAATAEVKGRSLWADAWRRLLGNRAAVVSAIILGVIAVLAVLGPLGLATRGGDRLSVLYQGSAEPGGLSEG